MAVKEKGSVTKLEIIKLKIEDLVPYEKNPRINEEAADYVAKSIKEFGFRIPILIDKNNVIVSGHTRYKACIKLGIKEVPCILVDDLDEKQIKAFRLIDNKASEKASWNIDLLNEEINELLDSLDMEDFDFDININDIPDDLDLERLEDDGDKERIEYLKFDNKKIPLTEEELAALNRSYDAYVQEHKTNYGYVKYLLGV